MRLFPMYTWNRTVLNLRTAARNFAHQPWANGVVLLCSVVVAMLLANLPVVKDLYHNLLHASLTINFHSENFDIYFPRNMTVATFINDVLMTVFFFTVGLEIKREVAFGELSTPKKASMPIIAAFGGVVMPALIFTLINHGTASASGWGIPTATDIAFAVCILSVLGDKVPISLKVFLTALAIADDLIAILVVAIFYGGNINLPLLLIAFVVIFGSFLLKRLGEKRMIMYIIPAIIVWVLFYYAGIHSTMSGVVMAFIIPMAPRYSKAYFRRKRADYLSRFEEYEKIEDDPTSPNGPQRYCLRGLSRIADGSVGISFRLEHALEPWVSFLIMPVFALANAGVEITDWSYFNVFQYSPDLGAAGMGVFLGLLIGKPLGITLASWLAIKCRVGEMPTKASWKMLFAVA